MLVSDLDNQILSGKLHRPLLRASNSPRKDFSSFIVRGRVTAFAITPDGQMPSSLI